MLVAARLRQLMPTTERSVTHANDEANGAVHTELDKHARLKKRTLGKMNFIPSFDKYVVASALAQTDASVIQLKLN